ncbi:RNAse P Rpr2/Rpp21/SNM1 subunit domain-containing protein [Phaeosphaeriaceae sp. PMI808]|nr:RNAse P Rpr2/Rpp21/SNM1 subunit domain-containing protein [Phaeosphaeriaceae sp. PMI808]
MSKVKQPKPKGIPSKHLHARTTFLYQAATYLTLQATANRTATDGRLAQPHSPLALQLASDLQQVSHKAQLRLSTDLKRTMCKRCNTILVPGRTATQTIENASKDGKKLWADVLFINCKNCGGQKKFPIGAQKQSKKMERKLAPVNTPSINNPPST